MKKLVISAEVLKSGLEKLGQVIHKSSVLPILSNLYFKVTVNGGDPPPGTISASVGEVELIASDLEVTIFYKCPCEVTGGGFEVLIPFEFLNKVVNLSYKVPIVIEMYKANKVTIRVTNDVYELNSLEKVSEFPKLPDLPKQKSFKLDPDFISIFGKAMTTVSQDELRPAMTKCCLDIKKGEMTIVSTDANCCFTRKIPIEWDQAEQLLISPKVAKIIKGFDETAIYWTAKSIALKCSKITVIATRHDEKYPNYKTVFPKTEANVTINRADFMAALERACLTSNASKLTQISFKGEQIHIHSTDTDLERDISVDIKGTITGDVPAISINSHKMLIMMHQLDYDEINLHIGAPTHAILISSQEEEKYLGLIMPLYESN